ncbi:MAG: CNNM domain-containing protein [Thermogemmata sp.]|nr:CNNM domain-containing protein [Thermogemmata sp.]
MIPLQEDTFSITPALVGRLVAIPILIAINGFFVAAEFALVAIRRTRVEELVQQGRAGAATLMAALRDLSRSVGACQLGITVASLALGFVSEPAIHRLLEPLLAGLPPQWTRVLSVLLTLTGITYMHVVFGEQMPKIAALQDSERIALWAAGPVLALARLSDPLIRLMNGSSAWLLRRLGYHDHSGTDEIHTVEELRLLIEDTEEAGLLDPEQADFVLNVFTLSQKKVRDCMVPRDKMAVLDLNMPPEKVLEVVRHGAHTRLPVYEGHLDNIVGIVNTKDLFYLFSTSGAVVLEDALYPAIFLGPDEPVAHALRLFRKAHRPMAIVRNAEGRVLGLITLEDVVEEIVGDIEDEHDVPVPKLKVHRRRPRQALRSSSGRGPGSIPPEAGHETPLPAPEGPDRATPSPPQSSHTSAGQTRTSVEGGTSTPQGYAAPATSDAVTEAQGAGPSSPEGNARQDLIPPATDVAALADPVTPPGPTAGANPPAQAKPVPGTDPGTPPQS